MKMKLRHALVLVLIALTASVGSVFAQQAPDPRVADLVKAGPNPGRVVPSPVREGCDNRRA
jgi:hypothetical protein